MRENGRLNTKKMDNNKLSTKSPQLDSPGKIHTYWIKATCDSRFCVLDFSEQKTYSLELTDGFPRYGPSDWTRLPRTKDLCFGFIIFIWNKAHTHTRTPMKTRMDSSKHSAAICIIDAGRTFNFLDNVSGQEVYSSPKPANGLSKMP